MQYTYSTQAFLDDRKEYYEMDKGLARAYGKEFAVASDLTLRAAREYLLTRPLDEEIDQEHFGNCLGVRTIRWLYPQAIEDDFHYIGFTTARGNFVDNDHVWHVPASYDFADLMWRCYDDEIAPEGKITVAALLDLIKDYL